MNGLANILWAIVKALEEIGKVAAATRVEDIINDEFPEFYDRARKAGESARDRLED